MRPDERFYIKSFFCESCEDDYENGEQMSLCSMWDSYSFHLDEKTNSFKTVNELIEKVCDLNCFDFNIDNWENFYTCSGEEADIGRYDTDILVDDMNHEASEEDIELWRKGKIKLYNCHIILFIGVKSVRELNLNDYAEIPH